VAKEETETKDRRTARAAGAANAVRARIAQLVWLICVLCALALAMGALLIALKANKHNGLVQFVIDAADAVDLGVFSKDEGIKQFKGAGAELKNALFNWGIGAIVWLVVGRILDRIIRP